MNKRCDICGEKIDLHRNAKGEVYWSEGHNAQPIAFGRCCDYCNYAVVIPARIQAMRKAREDSQ